MTFEKRGLGYKPDPHDARDKKFGAVRRLITVPHSLTLESYSPGTVDQLKESSCVTNAAAQGLRLIDRIAGGNMPLPSRNWIYYFARARDGGQRVDDGTQIRNAMWVLTKMAFPSEMYWEYDQSKVNVEPDFESDEIAADNKGLNSYQRIDTYGNARVQDVKLAIASGHPVEFGTDVSEAFCQNSPTGTVMPPGPRDVIAGGHAMLIVGYDGDRFRILNSWGPSYGDKGLFWMSAEYLTDPRTSDLWAMVRN